MTEPTFIDKNGEPRSAREVSDALAAIDASLVDVKWIVANPRLGVHLTTIRDVLKVYLAVLRRRDEQASR